MSHSSQLLQDAIDAFSRLPGVGKKSAMRLALHLIKQDRDTVSERYIAPLNRLVEGIKFCKKCHNLSDADVCGICIERSARSSQICVVESIRDVMAIEETGQYNGLYHVLGGVISPLDGVSADQLNIDTLVTRIAEDDIEELIMAISPTIEGETTIYYISKRLKDSGVKISLLARGISFGGELEYADEMTLGRSIATRTPYKVSEL